MLVGSTRGWGARKPPALNPTPPNNPRFENVEHSRGTGRVARSRHDTVKTRHEKAAWPCLHRCYRGAQSEKLSFPNSEVIQRGDLSVQGYLAHEKPSPLGPYSKPMRRVIWSVGP
jgi:hypothetical protein